MNAKHLNKKENRIMKICLKFLSGIVLITMVAATSRAQQLTSGGATCADALLNTTILPATHLNETTCGMFNDYSATNNTAQPCGDAAFTAGQDKVYAIQPATSGNILIFLTAAGGPLESDIAMFLYEGCPDVGACIASNTTIAEGSFNKTMGTDVIAGKTYFLMIDRKNTAPDCIQSYSLIINAPTESCPKIPLEAENKEFNADLELGGFLNWDAYTGTCCPINANKKGVKSGQHTITSGVETDPHSDDVITEVAPNGGKYSARLGNDINGAQAEKLGFDFTVTKDKNAVVYQYAVVLEDPGHQPEEQPRFEINVLRKDGSTVSCGQYKVVAGPAIPCFQGTSLGVIYKDWTTVGIDLREFVGEKITVEFATGDCSLGGHFGYAYLDAAVVSLKIQLLGPDGIENESGVFCEGDSVITLVAPEGFEQYNWSNGETTQRIKIKNPKAGDKFTCTLTPVTGFNCNSVLDITLQSFPRPVTGFSNDANCNVDPVTFTDQSTIAVGDTLVAWEWDFGDGAGSKTQSPQHLYAAPGEYTVKLTAISTKSCKQTFSQKIKLVGVPAFSLVSPDTLICNGNSASIYADVPSTGDTYTFNWNNGMNTQGITVNPVQTTNYIVEVTPSGGNASCSRKDTITIQVRQILASPGVACGKIDSGNVEFVWPKIEDATGYEVSTDGGTTWQVPSSGTTGTSHLIKGLQPGESRSVVVRALSDLPCAASVASAQQSCIFEDYYFYLPNSFSPNGDQENDTFIPKHVGVTGYKMSIYDRWGAKLYETEDINAGWDGSVDNKGIEKSMQGVYIYVVKMNSNEGVIKNLVGTVSLTR